MKTNGQSIKDDTLGKNIMLGVAGVAITTGAIAAGAALANKKNREMLKKGAENVYATVSNVAEKFAAENNGVKAVAHRIGIGKKKHLKKTKKSRV